MSKSKLTEHPVRNIFGRGSPFEMLCKLERELERLETATELDALIDHAMNFSLTAYHLIDWVWQLIDRQPEDRSEEYERADWIAAIGGRPVEPADVRDWAFRRCPELRVCQQLANTTKHLSFKAPTGASVAITALEETTSWKKRQEEHPFESILDRNQAENWRLTVTVDGEVIDLGAAFRERVFEFWSEVSYPIYIGEA